MIVSQKPIFWYKKYKSFNFSYQEIDFSGSQNLRRLAPEILVMSIIKKRLGFKDGDPRSQDINLFHLWPMPHAIFFFLEI